MRWSLHVRGRGVLLHVGSRAGNGNDEIDKICTLPPTPSHFLPPAHTAEIARQIAKATTARRGWTDNYRVFPRSEVPDHFTECGEFGADTTWGSVGENQVRQSVGGDDVRSVRIFRCFPRVFDSLYPGFTESTRGTLKNCMTKDLPNQSHSTGRFFRHDAHDSFFRKIS